jgi:hypothetical protein
MSREITRSPSLSSDVLVRAERVMDQLAALPDDEARSFVGSLPSEDLLLLMRSLSHGDLLVLADYANDEQMARVLDIDAWGSDGFLVPRFSEWIGTLKEVSSDRLVRFLGEADPELPTLALLKSGRVVPKHDFDEGEAEFDEELEQEMVTPDQQFVLIFGRDDPLADTVRVLLDHLFAADFDKARMILQAARWELASELEETLRRFRDARLEEMGIPDRDTARQVFAPLPKADELRFTKAATRLDVTMGAGRLTDVTLTRFREHAGDELEAAVSRLKESQRARFYQAVLYVANKVVVASGDSVGEPERVREAMALVAGHLRIALDLFGGVIAPETLLASIYPERLFRAAHTRILDLRKRARDIMDGLGDARAYELFDAPFSDFLERLLLEVPRFVRTGVLRVDEREFRSLADIDEAGEVLDVLEVWARFYGDMLSSGDASGVMRLPSSELRQLSFTRLLLTGMANRLLGRDWSFAPLDRLDLEALLDATSEERDGVRRLSKGLETQILEDFEGYLRASYASEGDGLPDRSPEKTRDALRSLMRRSLSRLEEVYAAAAQSGSAPDQGLVSALLLLVH